MSVVKRIHRAGMSFYGCDSCNKVSKWGDDDWRIWGSINDMEDCNEKHYCSDECMVKKHGKKSLKMQLEDIYH